MNKIYNIPFISCLMLIALFTGCSKKVDSSGKTSVPVNPGGVNSGATSGDDDYPDDEDPVSSSSSSSVVSSSSSSNSYSCIMGSSNPVSGSTNTSATLYFTCVAPSTAAYQCRVGSSSAWGNCTSNSSHTVAGLTVGAKRFEVRTRSSTGTTYGSAFYEWTVAAVPANVQTVVQDSTRSLSPLVIKMNFSSSGGTAPRTSQCQISGDALWQNCSTPWTVPGGTDPGANYIFSVKSTDANGVSSAVQSRAWTNGNWPVFPAQPELTCGQTIVYERNCNQPAPSVFNNSTTLTGLACQGDKYKSYTRTCTTTKIVTATYETTIGNLRTWNQDCTPNAPQSLDFRDAIMKFCSGNSYWHSGWGPVNVETLSNINASPIKATCFTSDNSTALVVSNAVLTSANPSCTPASNATSYACHMAAHSYCRSQGHAAGFGVTRRNSSGNQIVCMKNNSGAMVSTNFSTLQNYNPSCVASSPLSIECRNAAHYFCRAQTGVTSNYSGIGLYNASGSNADVYCVDRERSI